MKLTKLLLALLILTLPLIHGRVFQTLGFDIWLIVSGNFEFSKALYFNVFSAVIFTVFFLEYIIIWKHMLQIRQSEKLWLIAAILVLCISTYFSFSPFISLIWDLEKWHTSLLYINLIGIYIVFRHIKNTSSLIYAFILSWMLASAIALKELYYPSFDYGALWNRALWTLWHPNYLSGYLLLLLPFTFCSLSPFPKGRIQVGIKIWIALLFLTTIILCKSLIALFLAIAYVIFLWGRKNMIFFPFPLRRGLGWGVILGLTVLAAFVLIKYFPEKLHSLISRWYLWETTLAIIFSDIKILILWAGPETLPYYFNSFKVPELYIFENFWYSADRPHNFFLNIFYHFGLLWVWVFLYLLYKLFSLYQRKYPKGEGFKPVEYIWFLCLLLFLLYGVFHYFSISSYLLVIFALSLIPHSKIQTQNTWKIFISAMMFISLLWAFTSLRLYAWEIYYAKSEYRNALEMVFHPKYFLSFWEIEKAAKLEWIISEKNYKTQITLTEDTSAWCKNLTQAYPSAENYFYCWRVLEQEWKINISHDYYQSWLNKLPDLWNSSSPYWEQYFVKNTITGNRFFSPKFWDINSILEKVWIK